VAAADQLVEKFGIKCELAMHREPGPAHVEIRRVAPAAKQGSSVDGPRKEEMHSGANSGSSELDLNRGDAAAPGLQRRP
jgi:hypothetical protein